jgi:hypothetical protein
MVASDLQGSVPIEKNLGNFKCLIRIAQEIALGSEQNPLRKAF